MKFTALLRCLAILLLPATGSVLRAADDPVPPPGRPSREELKGNLKGLTPAERQAKIKEMRDKPGAAGLMSPEAQKRRADLEKLRESIKDLPPAERQAKLREWREKNVGTPGGPAGMTPEERESRRAEFSKRIQEQIKALEQKKAEGSLTEADTRRLQRMEEMSKRLESRGEGGDGGGLGLPLPLPPGEKPAAPGTAPAKPVKPAEAK